MVTESRRSERSLGARAARGGMVVIGGQLIRILLQLGSLVVLARLLGPSAFGVVASAMVVVGFGEIFRDFGLSAAAIQAKEVTRQQRDNLWWANVSIGLGLMVVCWLSAPLVALAFEAPDVTQVLRWLSLTFLLNGMTAQYRADLTRRMRFSALTFVDVAAQSIGVAAAIVLAMRGAGYWALVAQQLVAAALTGVAYPMAAGWWPRLPSRSASIRAFFRFSAGLVGSQVVYFLNSNIDNLVIGTRFGEAQLGYYSRGYQLIMRTLGQLRAPTTSVALPVLSRVNDDRDQAGRFLVSGQRALCYPLVTALGLVAGLAQPIVTVVYGPQWSATAPVVAFLAVAGAFQTVAFVGSWVYLSRALTAALFRYSLVMCAWTVLCVVVGSQWGITGVAAGFATAFGVEWQVSQWYLSRLTPIPLRQLYLGAWRILGLAALGGSAAYGIAYWGSQWPDAVQIVAGASAVVVVYGLAMVFPAVRADIQDVASFLRKARQR